MLDDRCYGAILSGKSTRVVGGKVLARKFSVGKMDRATYSAYYYDLDVQAKSRYRDKLAKVGIMTDPYLPSTASSIDWQDWPDVQYPDVYNYLVETPSLYTRQQLKAYKSLEAYKQFVDGWVGNVTVRRVPCAQHTCVVNARVRHSQRIFATAVHAWVAVEQGGVVLCAHCTCMAGLGEACSHIATILFTLDSNTRTKQSTSCTSLPCSWLPPTLSNVPYSEIADIDFSTPAQKRRKTESVVFSVCQYITVSV